MKKRDIIIIAISIIAVLIIGAGAGIASNNLFKNNKGRNQDRNTAAHERKDKDSQIGRIDSINQRSIIITLGELERPEKETENSSKEETQNFNIEDNFKASDKKVTLTAPEDIDIASLEAGMIVSVEYDENNQITSIHDFSDFKTKDSKRMDRNVGVIDSIENNTVVITKGELNRDQQKESTSDSSITDDFVPGEEKLTLTVDDTSILSDLKAGDVVTFNYEDQKLESIQLLGNAFRGPKQDNNQDRDMNDSQNNKNKGKMRGSNPSDSTEGNNSPVQDNINSTNV